MIIYKTTNLINGKVYIGKYKGTNKFYFGSGKLIKQAIEKYGKENFIRETLEDGITDEQILDEKEIYWIKYYHARDRGVGYNLAEGGRGNSNPSEETRKLLSEAAKGKPSFWKTHPMSLEAKIKMSENHAVVSGSCNPMFGVIRDQQWRADHSVRMKNRKYDRKPMTQEEKDRRMYSQVGIKQNRKSPCSSQYVGVTFHKRDKNWVAVIHDPETRRPYQIGSFTFELEAAMAWNEALLELYGWKLKDRINIIAENDLRLLWES